jgi:hypothetical protein
MIDLSQETYDSGVNEPLQARALLEHARKIGRSKMARLENRSEIFRSKIARLENRSEIFCSEMARLENGSNFSKMKKMKVEFCNTILTYVIAACLY